MTSAALASTQAHEKFPARRVYPGNAFNAIAAGGYALYIMDL